MSDHYNLRPRPTVTATEGMDVEQAPEGPGPMAAELPGPTPTQVEEGQAPEVDVNVEGHMRALRRWLNHWCPYLYHCQT